MQQTETAVIYSDDADTQQMIDLLLSRKQQVVKFATQRPLKVRKNEAPIVKHSVFTAVIGQVYDEIQSVIDRRESGELPAENQGLPWGEWAVFPYIIAHKGEYYVRCTVDPDGERQAPRFTRGGAEITRAEAEQAALASEFRSSDDSPIFNIRLSSVVAAE